MARMFSEHFGLCIISLNVQNTTPILRILQAAKFKTMHNVTSFVRATNVRHLIIQGHRTVHFGGYLTRKA